MKKGRGGSLPALLFVSALLMCGCRPGWRCAPGNDLVRSELYFGMVRPEGGAILEGEWEDFLVKEVTPRFPGGFTVLGARGQWRDSSGKISREPSKVLVIIHGADRNAGGKIEEIRNLYRKRFSQESVLRADMPVRASF